MEIPPLFELIALDMKDCCAEELLLRKKSEVFLLPVVNFTVFELVRSTLFAAG